MKGVLDVVERRSYCRKYFAKDASEEIWWEV